ncbi:MAG: 4a-hydroxytetrahydrobiopterin dehydratase [Planctomycetota bacterium]|jgi:4a-hydroxytetrahydrobiopterin dehydratase
MARGDLLRDEEIAAALGHLPGWQQTNGALRRIYEFADFREAMKFVHRVADVADAAGHHPRIEVKLHRVTLTVTTDEEGGLTPKDIDLMRRIDG